MEILFHFSPCAEACLPTRQVRRSAQVLGSCGKQTAHLLPTFLLRINEVDENCAKQKIPRNPDGKQTGGDKK
jgi:hypothetical protein